MKAYLLHYETEDRKFYAIEVKGNEHLTTTGDYGTDGETTTKQYDSPEAAQKEAHDVIKQLKEEGYIEMIEDSEVFRDDYSFAGKLVEDAEWDIYLEEDTLLDVNRAIIFSESIVENLEYLAECPYSDLVENLVVGEYFDEDIDGFIDILVQSADAFSGLKHLFIAWADYDSMDISHIPQTDYSNFYQHYPQLESFVIRGSDGLRLGKMNLPKLKHLVIESNALKADVIKDISDSDLPNLEHLEIWLGTSTYGCDIEAHDLQGILDGKFSKLTYLGLKNYDKQDELIQKLQGASVLNNLDTLDISLGVITDKGAEALYNNDALLRLQHINCCHHYISDEWQEKLKTKFAKQNINFDRKRDMEYGNYYVAVSE